MFVNIDETFHIKKNINQNDIQKCVSFISNQKNLKKLIIYNAYKFNNIEIINLPNEINKKDINIIIKTKFNKDYKYINLNKNKIFCETNKKIKFIQKKIDYFQLNKIKFFPKTFISKNFFYQNLAKGKMCRPNDLSGFTPKLLKNIALVVNNLSLRNNSELKISNYLINSKFVKRADHINHKIIDVFNQFLNKNSNQKIKLALTHGDFKFEHLFSIKGKLEYVIDWECVEIRSIFFDLINFFLPWFVRRSYNYLEIKEYILNFVTKYLPILQNNIDNMYDIYFSIYALERYKRIQNGRTSKFDISAAHKRYNLLFKNLVMKNRDINF